MDRGIHCSTYSFGVYVCVFFTGVTLINISEAMALLNRLGTSGLLLIEHSRADINQSVSSKSLLNNNRMVFFHYLLPLSFQIFLNVNADDIHYALNPTAPAS